MTTKRIDECCIGDSIEFQEGDDLPLCAVKYLDGEYQPSPHQMRAWGRSRTSRKFRMGRDGRLVRYE